MVRAEGLEPPQLSPPEPKSGVSANFTTPAKYEELLTYGAYTYLHEFYYPGNHILERTIKSFTQFYLHNVKGALIYRLSYGKVLFLKSIYPYFHSSTQLRENAYDPGN